MRKTMQVHGVIRDEMVTPLGTRLYDRRREAMTLDEVEKIGI